MSSVFDKIELPENIVGMKKLLKRLGSRVSDTEVREALVFLADRAAEHDLDEEDLRARIARYEENPKSRLAKTALINGMDFRPLWYASRQFAGGTDILTFRTGEKRKDALVIFIFEEDMDFPVLDDCSFVETSLDEILEVCDDNELRYLLINPETDHIAMSVDDIRYAMEISEDTDEFLTMAMDQGVSRGDFFPLILEAFVGEEVKVTRTDGVQFSGILQPWRSNIPVMDQQLTILSGPVSFHFRLQDVMRLQYDINLNED